MHGEGGDRNESKRAERERERERERRGREGERERERGREKRERGVFASRGSHLVRRRGRERDREREFESGGLLSRFVEGYDDMMQEIKFQKKKNHY